MVKALQKLAAKKAVKSESQALQKQQHSSIAALKKLQEMQLKHLQR